MNLATLSDHAAQVIVADITAVESHWMDNPRRIETSVRLENIEYWKGGYEGAPASFELIVPGGRVGLTEMRICCAPEYRAGQRRVLFLLADYKTVPTVGLGQGAFRIINDAEGIARVYHDDVVPITGISPDGWPQTAGERHGVHDHLAGASTNVRLQQPALKATEPAMTLHKFQSALQPFLDASRDHALKRPAGRRIAVTFQPTAIKPRPAVPGAAGDAPTVTRSPQSASGGIRNRNNARAADRRAKQEGVAEESTTPPDRSAPDAGDAGKNSTSSPAEVGL